MRWKEKALDLPVSRQATRLGTHPSAPLKAGTYAYRLRHLGRLADFDFSIGQRWFKPYFEWVIHQHNRITAGSSIKNYWQVLKMHMPHKFERRFIVGDVSDMGH